MTRKVFLMVTVLTCALAASSALADMPAWDYPLSPQLLENREGYLTLVNRDHLLSSDYVPSDLVVISARHINDMDSTSHRGFECFRHLLDRYRPTYFLHGHIHKSYGVKVPQKTQRGGTTIINAYDHCILEV